VYIPLYLGEPSELTSMHGQYSLSQNVGLWVGGMLGSSEGAGVGNEDGIGLGDGLGIREGDSDGKGVVGKLVGLGDGIKEGD